MYLGFDTSNYTTSVACFDGNAGENKSRLLDVRSGELGLRQSDAVFSHIKRLPELADALFASCARSNVAAIGVSSRPRAVEGSYMPCFLVGTCVAKTIASTLGVPYYEFSHQQGHIAAALWSANRLDLMKRPHLAWHLSGGTTELLLVEPDGKNVRVTRIGGSEDISAGQIMDRTGKMLALDFPAGKAIDMLAAGAVTEKYFPVKIKDFSFSLSGLENKILEYLHQGNSNNDVAYYAVRSVCEAVIRATKNALNEYSGMPVVLSGGVASNSMLREKCKEFDGIFAKPCYSTDNAMGIAVLTWMQENEL